MKPEKAPRGLTAKYVKRKLREIAKEVKFYDKIVIAGLVASGLQLTVSFAFSGSWVSWAAAIFKALFIEACTWIFNKSISRAKEMGQDRRFIWFCLIVVMLVSVRANLKYIYKEKLAQKAVALKDPKIALVTDYNIEENLDFGDKVDAVSSGALIPLLILGVIAARGIQSQGADTFERAETVKINNRERTSRYRARKRKEGLGGTR